MWLRIILTLSCMLCFSDIFSNDVNVLPSNRHLKYEGRVLVNRDSASFCYPGTAVRITFRGSSISAKLKSNAGFYLVELDNIKPYKLSTYGKSDTRDSLFSLADNLNEGVHSLQLTLVNEGFECHPQFLGFSISNSHSLLSVAPKRHTIEFIGNSITCGYGIESSRKEDGFSDSTENQSLAFSGLVARYFNASSMVVARSGIGVYRNFGESIAGSDSTLPSFYDRTFIYKSPKWDFSEFFPELVCVGLGTNDLSQGDYDLQLFESAYLSFVRHIHIMYPKSEIILMGSPMLHEKRLADQLSVLDRVAATMNNGVTFVYRFNFSEQNGSLGYGANWHPSILQQRKMAEELSTFIEENFPSWRR